MKTLIVYAMCLALVTAGGILVIAIVNKIDKD